MAGNGVVVWANSWASGHLLVSAALEQDVWPRVDSIESTLPY